MPRRQVKKDGLKPDQRPVIADEEGELQAGGNQWVANERQLKWLEYYMNPREKETYAKPYDAAIKAGFSHHYARQIMSNSRALDWVKSAKSIMRSMNTEHLRSQLEDIAISKNESTRDRIQAIKLLGTDQGMFVQKSITAHIGIEQALSDLE